MQGHLFHNKKIVISTKFHIFKFLSLQNHREMKGGSINTGTGSRRGRYGRSVSGATLRECPNIGTSFYFQASSS